MTTHLAFVWSPNKDFSYFRFLLWLQTQHKKLYTKIILKYAFTKFSEVGFLN